MLALAAQHGMEDFYTEKYLNTLRVGAETESNELFDKSHGFYIAVVQGFFRDYYYTRGSGFSFLLEEKPEYARYFTPWAQVAPTAFPNPAENQIIEITAPVCTCLQSRSCSFSGIWSRCKGAGGSGGALARWTVCSAEKGPHCRGGTGCRPAEATEVVEPNPISPNESTSYSTCTTVIEMGCIFIWTPSADRSKMLSGKVRNKYEQ